MRGPRPLDSIRIDEPVDVVYLRDGERLPVLCLD